MMKSLYLRICQVATQLQREGKNPSLARVRARLGGGVDGAELLNAYQQWRANPQVVDEVPTPAAVATSEHAAVNTTQAQLHELRSDMQRLEAKVDQILQLLQMRTNDVGR